MGSNAAHVILASGEAEDSETTIEIKIKTLDAQTYTLRVDKQMPVPALKEQIASVTGVLSEQQRLICRGKVLKDDQLLSAYHVEDGHTLHLVVRQPVPPASESQPGSSLGQGNQQAPNVIVEAFSMPDQGNGALRDLSRIVSAVLGSIGITTNGSGSEGVDAVELDLERSTQLQPQQAGATRQPDTSTITSRNPSVVPLGPLQPPVIPDSLTTLSQYLSQLTREFHASGRGWENNHQPSSEQDSEEREPNAPSLPGLPTPASLAEVMRSTRQMLIEQAGECLFQLARQLETQANVIEPSARLSTQSNAWRVGVLLQNLGAFLLELGRTTMTLRLGRSPPEAMVNAGPAVFISPSGPNPLMVQPLPFQPGTSFGALPTGSTQPGYGYFPRRIDIQIRRGSPVAPTNINQEGTPNPLPSVSSGMLGIYYPVPGRQHVPSGSLSDRRESQLSAVQQQNTEDPARDVSVRANNSTELESIQSGYNIDILSSEGNQNQESERQIPRRVVQFLSSLFPGGEIHVDDVGIQGLATDPAPSGSVQAQDPAPQVSEEGAFLSSLLSQIMPIISQQTGYPNGTNSEEESMSTQAGNSDVGTSRARCDLQEDPPNSKRQKME